MSEGASALRPDLVDAVAAYRHFLTGNGTAREFSYERYLMNDASGRVTLRSIILEAQHASIRLWEANSEVSTFQFTGPIIPCGSSSYMTPRLNNAFPYPARENWQKTIGAHIIWLSGSVVVEDATAKGALPDFRMNWVVHVEDQYNFNPGQNDVATGIPDDSNGSLVVAGLAHGYLHTSTVFRTFNWKGSELGVSSMQSSPVAHHPRPMQT